MRFKKALMIPVYVYTEEQMDKLNIGLDVDGDDEWDEIRPRPFWVIDYACDFRGDQNKVSFFVNGESFVTTGTLEEFTKIIDNHINQ